MADSAARSPAPPEAARDPSRRAPMREHAAGPDALPQGALPDALGALKASRIAGAGYAVPMAAALLRAQRLYGNQAVQRMLRGAAGPAPAPTQPGRRPRDPARGATGDAARADRGVPASLLDGPADRGGGAFEGDPYRVQRFGATVHDGCACAAAAAEGQAPEEPLPTGSSSAMGVVVQRSPVAAAPTREGERTGEASRRLEADVAQTLARADRVLGDSQRVGTALPQGKQQLAGAQQGAAHLQGKEAGVEAHASRKLSTAQAMLGVVAPAVEKGQTVVNETRGFSRLLAPRLATLPVTSEAGDAPPVVPRAVGIPHADAKEGSVGSSTALVTQRAAAAADDSGGASSVEKVRPEPNREGGVITEEGLPPETGETGRGEREDHVAPARPSGVISIKFPDRTLFSKKSTNIFHKEFTTGNRPLAGGIINVAHHPDPSKGFQDIRVQTNLYERYDFRATIDGEAGPAELTNIRLVVPVGANIDELPVSHGTATVSMPAAFFEKLFMATTYGGSGTELFGSMTWNIEGGAEDNGEAVPSGDFRTVAAVKYSKGIFSLATTLRATLGVDASWDTDAVLRAWGEHGFGWRPWNWHRRWKWFTWTDGKTWPLRVDLRLRVFEDGAANVELKASPTPVPLDTLNRLLALNSGFDGEEDDPGPPGPGPGPQCTCDPSSLMRPYTVHHLLVKQIPTNADYFFRRYSGRPLPDSKAGVRLERGSFQTALKSKANAAVLGACPCGGTGQIWAFGTFDLDDSGPSQHAERKALPDLERQIRRWPAKDRQGGCMAATARSEVCPTCQAALERALQSLLPGGNFKPAIPGAKFPPDFEAEAAEAWNARWEKATGKTMPPSWR